MLGTILGLFWDLKEQHQLSRVMALLRILLDVDKHTMRVKSQCMRGSELLTARLQGNMNKGGARRLFENDIFSI